MAGVHCVWWKCGQVRSGVSHEMDVEGLLVAGCTSGDQEVLR